MANRIDVRVSPFEKELAQQIADEMGISVSEMMRFFLYRFNPNYERPDEVKYKDQFGRLIDAIEVPPVGISVLKTVQEENQKADERFNQEASVITELRYLNLLVKNIANNENQIAHALNKINKNHQNKIDFEDVQSQLDDLKKASQKAQARLENHFHFNYHNRPDNPEKTKSNHSNNSDKNQNKKAGNDSKSASKNKKK